jgi:hypothetical protein
MPEIFAGKEGFINKGSLDLSLKGPKGRGLRSPACSNDFLSKNVFKRTASFGMSLYLNGIYQFQCDSSFGSRCSGSFLATEVVISIAICSLFLTASGRKVVF